MTHKLESRAVYLTSIVSLLKHLLFSSNSLIFLSRHAIRLVGALKNLSLVLTTRLPPRHGTLGTAPVILWIDFTWPFRPDNAGATRTLALFGIFKTLGYQVVFLSGDSQIRKQTTSVATVVSSITELNGLISNNGILISSIWISRFHTAALWQKSVKAAFPSTPIVFDTVDLTHLRFQRMASQFRGSFWADAAERVRELELGLARSATATTVVSSVEKAILVNHAIENVHLLSLVQEVSSSDLDAQSRSGTVFVGNFLHSPNVSAVTWLIREVWPLVAPEIRAQGLRIVGPNAPKSILRLAGTGVTFVGRVDDVKPFIQTSIVSVAPLLYGAGVKGKIAESMALGVPVVTTTIGAEGMGLEHLKSAVIADTAEDFARGLELIHSQPSLAQLIGKAGSGVAQEMFSESRARAQTLSLLDSLGISQ